MPERNLFSPAASSVIFGVFVVVGLFLQRFLLAFPFCKLPLAFFVLVICQNIRPDAAGDLLNLVL